MPCLVSRTPHGASAAICSARLRARGSRSRSASTTSATSPMRSASSASTRRPVSISSCEREAPIRRGSSQLVPMSQLETPMLMKAARNTAVAAGVADVAAQRQRQAEAGRRAR